MADRQIYELHASICHTLANPKRLEIIDHLHIRELSVTELAEALEISQANLSQHLSLMRQGGIVTTRRGVEHLLQLEQSQDHPGV